MVSFITKTIYFTQDLFNKASSKNILKILKDTSKVKTLYVIEKYYANY